MVSWRYLCALMIVAISLVFRNLGAFAAKNFRLERRVMELEQKINSPSSISNQISSTEERAETSENFCPACLEVTFTPEHPLCRLRDLWVEEEKQNGPLNLCLLPSQEQNSLISPEDFAQETAALESSLTHFADQRLKDLLSILASGNSSPCMDEFVFVHTALNGMAAWLLLFPPIGQGKKLTLLQLIQALSRHKVSHGIDLPLLRQIPTLSERYFVSFLIARGTAPGPGTDGQVLNRHPLATNQPAPIQAFDHIDYRKLNLVQDIKKDEIICEIVPPTRGASGNTVSGTLIPGQDGKPARVPQGRNTVLTPDGRYLIAGRDGHLEYSGRNFQVKPVLEIFDSIDPTKGDINFLGDIHIYGDICCGATVRAMGNIQVDGVIESCNIEAGENLIVSSGIQGQDCAIIRVHKSVYAKYLDHCDVYAREGVQADCIIDCAIYSNGPVKARTGRGVIIGGVIRSATEVSATTVGSKAERPTSIILGGMPYEEFEKIQILKEFDKANLALEKEQAQPDTPEKQSKLSKLRLDLYVIQMKLDKFNKDIEAMQAQLAESSHKDPYRLICDAAYPGISVTMNHQTFRVDRMRQHCVIGLSDGLIGFV